MNDDIPPAASASASASARASGRPFQTGQSGNPAGRPPGARNKATSAAAALLDDEAEGLTRKAVELALAGDPLALRLCLERVLPRCRQRPICLRLPRFPVVREGGAAGPSPQDIYRIMQTVTMAAASGEITPGEAAVFARVVETFVRTIATAKKENIHLNLLQILTSRPRDEEKDPDSEDDEDLGDDPDAADWDT